MGKYSKYGLLRDNNLSDLSNPTRALANLLTKISSTYTPEDIKSVIDDISQIYNPYYGNLYTLLNNSDFFKGYDIPVDSTGAIIQPLLTVKNRLDIVKLVCGEPAFYGGNGLTTDYFNWSAIYGNDASSPVSFSESAFNGKTPLYSEVFWERGNFNYGYNTPMNENITQTAGVIRYTGFFKPIQTGIHTYTITAGNNDSGTTGSVYIKITDLNDNLVMTSAIYQQDVVTNVTFSTSALQKYTYYKITIYFLRSPNQIISNPWHNLTISLASPNNSGGLPLYYLYSSDYLSKQIGKINTYFRDKVLLGGTNYFTTSLSGENNSIGGLLSSNYRSLVTSQKLYLDYTPPPAAYKCLSFYTAPSSVTLSANTNVISSPYLYAITNLDGTTGYGYEGAQVGNLILSKQKSLSPLTYVKEVINNNTIVLTNNILSSTKIDTLYFINPRGLKGYSQGYTVSPSTTSIQLTSSFYGDERGYTSGDVVVTVDLDTSGDWPYDSNIVSIYTQISSLLPNNAFNLKKGIQYNSKILRDTTLYEPGFILFYYKSGLSNNLSLRGYCSGGTIPTIASGNLTLSALIGTTELIITGDILDYTGNKLTPKNLVSTNTALSVFEVSVDSKGTNIPFNTYVVNATVSSVIISQPLTLNQPINTSVLFGLSTPQYNARDINNDSRQSCFVSGDHIYPFARVIVGSLSGIRTPSAPEGNLIFPNSSIQFNTLKYIKNPVDTNITQLTGDVSSLTFTNTLPITGLNNSIFYLFATQI